MPDRKPFIAATASPAELERRRASIRKGAFLTSDAPASAAAKFDFRTGNFSQTAVRAPLPPELREFEGAAEAADRFGEIERRNDEITRKLREVNARLEAYRKARK